MDKIRMYSQLIQTVGDFEAEGAKWQLTSGWGDLLLEQPKDGLCYALDREVSAVPNISLLIMSIKKDMTRAGISYTFSLKPDKESALLRIKTPVEELAYLFRRLPFSSLALYRRELEELKAKAEHCMGRRPIVGTCKLPKVVKDTPLDFTGEFDYSFLKLTKPPIVFLAPRNQLGYAAVRNKTPAACEALLHWHNPPKDEPWELDYCIFPLEGVEAPRLEELKKAPRVDEHIDSYEAVWKAVKAGRLLVVYEDIVIDIADFIEHHPGLATSLRPYIGREIGRWVYGAVDHEGKVHPHSENALELMLKYRVGRIDDPYAKRFHVGVPAGALLQNQEFALVEEVNGVTDVHVLAKLKNNDIRVTPLLNKVESFGRYYTMENPITHTSRNYAAAFTAEESINNEHMRLANAIETKKDYDTPYPEIAKVELEYVPLVVKPKGALSRWLAYDAQPGWKVLLRGPFVR
jgi:hypothetical protein